MNHNESAWVWSQLLQRKMTHQDIWNNPVVIPQCLHVKRLHKESCVVVRSLFVSAVEIIWKCRTSVKSHLQLCVSEWLANILWLTLGTNSEQYRLEGPVQGSPQCMAPSHKWCAIDICWSSMWSLESSCWIAESWGWLLRRCGRASDKTGGSFVLSILLICCIDVSYRQQILW